MKFNHSSIQSFGELIRYIRPWRNKVRFASICSILNKVFDIAPEVLIGVAVDLVVEKENSFVASLGFSSIESQVIYAQNKLDTAQDVKNEILEQAKKDSDRLIIELNDKFHKSSDLKKNLAENKINQMKENAIKEIKDASIKIAVDSVKKIITTSVDSSKLDNLFQKNLDETKEELKKINS